MEGEGALFFMPWGEGGGEEGVGSVGRRKGFWEGRELEDFYLFC